MSTKKALPASPNAGLEAERAEADAASRSQRITDLKYLYPVRYLASWAALLLLVCVALVVAPSALGGRSLWVVTALAGVLALASMGQMLIVMIGAIDLSVPATLAAAAGIVVHYGGDGANLPLVFFGALVAGTAISTVNGVLISVLQLNALIVTLGTFGVVSGLIGLWTGVSFSVSGQAPSGLQSIASASLWNVNACLFFAVAVAAVLAIVLRRTRAGRQVAAVGSNRRAARALGLRVKVVEVSTFAVAGLLYSAAGILLAGFVGTPDTTVGAPYQLATITAVGIAGVLFAGGPASVASVVVSCVFLQLLDQTLAVLGLAAGARTVAQGLALVVAVAAITVATYGASSFQRSTRWLRGRH